MKSLGIEYKNKIGIYFIKNLINNKVYIGSSKNLHKRWTEHIRLLNNNKHYAKHLQYSYNKYGQDNFEIELFSIYNDVDRIIKIEPLLIKLFNATNDKYGYNTLSEYIGTHGIKFSKERCKNISESLKGRVAHNKGKRMCESQIIKLIDVNTKRRGKKIDIYSIDGSFIKTNESIMSIVREYNIDKRSIQRVLKGEYSMFNGFVFRYHGDTFNKFALKDTQLYKYK